MIVDTLDNLGKYVALNPLFQDVIDFMKTHDLLTLEPGKHPMKGSDLFLNISHIKGKTKEAALMETHKNMLDIQIPLNGEETFGYTPLCDLPQVEYNAEKDASKYAIQAQTYFTCKPGQFALFFPQDGHTPCISDAELLIKATFKVKV